MGGCVCGHGCTSKNWYIGKTLCALLAINKNTTRKKTDDIILIESILSFKYLKNFMENFWTVFFLFWDKFITPDRIAQITQMKWYFRFFFICCITASLKLSIIRSWTWAQVRPSSLLQPNHKQTILTSFQILITKTCFELFHYDVYSNMKYIRTTSGWYTSMHFQYSL